MSKNKIADYDQTADINEDIAGIGIKGSDPVRNMDNALREVMSHLADMNAGDAPLEDTFCVADPTDNTKKVRIAATNVSAGQTRVLTAPDVDGTIWTDGNDGENSGLDADLLDGQEGAYYLDADNFSGVILDQSLPLAITSHVIATGNPHSLTKADLELENVDNIADLNKVISIAVQAALDEKLSLNGGVMTGSIDLNGNEIIGLVSLPVGAEMPWQNATPPTGWFIQDGSTFDAVTYPLLNTHLGGGILPDARGVVLRGNDNGRGINAGRVLGSYEDDQNALHTHSGSASSGGAHSHSISLYTNGGNGGVAAAGANAVNGSSTNSGGSHTHNITISSQGGGEARMKNISKNWIIKHD